ncbi:CapA family protein [Bacillus sp. UNCCL81]|uniref:CapA family protein n=1 Tax=Bacillus sp. UNCCL81 TaxID=1502755 RepID=UPI0008F05D5F|nr:CapA family protein [Bacillus sp. UNCCL81]SFD50203.1 poly-gamma-glutamate synthesis protein (capsule biosynthesis protein) [Bacillus sp. UNCCL81]
MRSRKDKNTEKRNSKKIVIWFMILVLFGCISGFSYFVYKKVYEESNLVKHETENKVVDKPKSIKKPAIKPPVQKPENNNTAKPKNIETTIKISAAGDFTLGSDEDFQYINSFPAEANKNGLAYFTKGLNNIFKQDDLSTVNLETTLTNSKIRASKTFRFKGNPSYAKILTLSGIEAVNVANNHSHDYMQKGFEDTINNLKKEKIGYFGYNDQYVTTIKGIKVAALGYEGWNDSPDLRIKINNDIQNLRKSGVKIILIHFHWGIERDYVPNSTQKNLAHYAIDHGADLIVGHHPHVVQGIEEYKGKFIVYSLGNFMFGGNKNPKDKDTFVFQQTFHLNNGILTNQKEIRIVPFSISSVSSRNNYQPLFLKGPEEQRVKKKIIYVSNKIHGSNWTQYEK